MEEKNPFDGIKTCDSYGRLWGLTAGIVLLYPLALLPVVLLEKYSGLRFTSLESLVPVFLAICAVSAAVLSGLGVSWRDALADWRRNFAADALKGLKYFGGYLLILLCLLGGVMAAWRLLGGGGLQELMRPMAGRAVKEGLMLQVSAAAPLRFLLTVFSACVLAPLAEEFYFRRIFFTTLRRRNGFWFSAFWSGLFFALGHGAAAPALLPVGIYFCWVYERERRLPVNIMLHSLVNAAMLLSRMNA